MACRCFSLQARQDGPAFGSHIVGGSSMTEANGRRVPLLPHPPRPATTGRESCGAVGSATAHIQAAMPTVYGDDMDVLYLAASGPSDPTRASIPWHLAVNGSVEAGQSTAVVLLGDASGVVAPAVRDELAGIGIPPLRELIAKARDRSLPVFV